MGALAWPRRHIKLTFTRFFVFFFFNFFFLSLKDQWTNMLGRKIHKVSHQKEAISIHWLLFVHQDLCSDNRVTLTWLLRGQHWCTHLTIMSLSRGPAANLWQKQDSNSGLSWTQTWALLTPWKTLEKRGRPPRERDQHRIRGIRILQALFLLPNTLPPVPLLLSYTPTHTFTHTCTGNI